MGVRILTGDCRTLLRGLPESSVQCCVTSPPYFGLRDYGVDGQIGLEPTPEDFVAAMVEVFREVRRVLRDDGTLWLNLGDSYNADGRKGRAHMGEGKNSGYSGWQNKVGFGTKPKDLLMIPARVALALQADGWWLRSDIIWHKPNPMPESVTDRPTSAHEHVFLLTKNERYFYDADAIREEAVTDDVRRPYGSEGAWQMDGRDKSKRPNGKARASDAAGKLRNSRNVWTIATQPFSEAHFATMAPDLAERCIKAGSKQGDTVLDPFGGAGTTGLVADRLNRHAVLLELNPEYAEMAERRIRSDAGMFASTERGTSLPAAVAAE